VTRISAAALAALLAVSACASTQTSLIMAVMPPHGKPLGMFTDDDTVCRHYAAAQVDGNAAHANWTQATVGAGGTLLRAGLGAAIGGGQGRGDRCRRGCAGRNSRWHVPVWQDHDDYPEPLRYRQQPMHVRPGKQRPRLPAGTEAAVSGAVTWLYAIKEPADDIFAILAPPARSCRLAGLASIGLGAWAMRRAPSMPFKSVLQQAVDASWDLEPAAPTECTDIRQTSL
jgi:hypothetical protein